MVQKEERRILKTGKLSWLLILMLLTTLPAFAQVQKIEGSVIDSQGEPVIGASVI